MNSQQPFVRQLLIVCAATLLAQAAVAGPRRSPAGPRYVEGEVLVHYRTTFAPLARTVTPMAMGAQEIREIPHIGWHHLKLAGSMTTLQAVALLKKDPGVDFAEPNYYRHATQFIPTDPDYPKQYGPRMIGCEQGWTLTLGSRSVKIGFIDTGIDTSNAEFLNRITIASGCNIVSHNSNPTDDNDHGTHVAGIATAALDNAIGIAGICPTATILPVKALDATGSGTVANLAAGYMFAADNGANIVNASLGGNDASNTELDAVNYVVNQGIPFVAAAGNSGDQGNQLFYPAAYPGAIGVGAVDSTGTYAPWSQSGTWVKVAAPGVQIYSTYPDGQYAYNDGTSMSAPHVSGALALLIAYAPAGTSTASIENALYGGCTSLGSLTQYGIINVYNSMQLLTTTTQSQTLPFASSSYAGVITSGTTNALDAVDNVDLSITGTIESDGSQVAGFKSTYLLTQNVSSITRLTITMNASASASATSYAYAYNFFKGRYDLIGTVTLGTLASNISLPMASVRPYDRAGEVRLLFIAKGASGPPFSLNVDQSVVTVSTNGGP